MKKNIERKNSDSELFDKAERGKIEEKAPLDKRKKDNNVDDDDQEEQKNRRENSSYTKEKSVLPPVFL